MTVRVAPVSRLLTVTAAPPIAAPDASSTFPEIVGVTCAHAFSELATISRTPTARLTNPPNRTLVIPELLCFQAPAVYEKNEIEANGAIIDALGARPPKVLAPTA